MAKFTCDKYPELLVIGAGQFRNGHLEVDGDAAKKVKRVAKRFGITEGGKAEAKDAEVPEEKESAKDKGDNPDSDGSKAPASNAKREEVVQWAVENKVVDSEDDLKGKTVADIRELIDAHLEA